jgi:hypothetical protein
LPLARLAGAFTSRRRLSDAKIVGQTFIIDFQTRDIDRCQDGVTRYLIGATANGRVRCVLNKAQPRREPWDSAVNAISRSSRDF